MKKKIIPVIAVIVLILLVVLFMVFSTLIDKYSLGTERQDLSDYYGITSDTEVPIIINDTVMEEKGRLVDGIVYLDYTTVSNYINERFYWDHNENKLLYTTSSDLITVDVESPTYLVTKESQSLDHTIVKADASTAYIAVDFLSLYSDFTYEYYEEPSRLVIYNSWGDYTTATIKKDTQIRYQGGIKSPILEDVAKGTVVTVLEAGDTWTKVASIDGVIGYVQSKRLGSTETATRSSDFVPEEFSHITKNFEINLAWHQVTNQTANGQIASVLQNTKGINVISPTWYYLNDNTGGINSLANSDYVSYCHQNGIEVWALVSNLEDSSVDTTAVLTYTSNRERLINNLVSSAIQYNLDGINVDFEALSSDVGDGFIQFIRELSLKCANNGIVLSVDNYVPSNYTVLYQREEQAVFADYVILMAYDEHYSGSETAGSVASIGFVEKGITDTLAEGVPANQLILGMPFYTRVWTETPTEDTADTTDTTDAASDTSADSPVDSYTLYTLDSYATGMSDVQSLLSANGVTPVWSDADGQNYAEYENKGSIYKIWIEDSTSLEEKLKLMDKNQLAGGAFWKLGFETPATWDTIIKYIN